MTKAELLAQYENLTGNAADRRWSVQRLADRVEELTKVVSCRVYTIHIYNARVRR